MFYVGHEHLAWMLKYYGLPVALVSGDKNHLRVHAVLRVVADRTDLRGLDIPDDAKLVPFQRDSADFWQRNRVHNGTLGWDRGVLVDGGLFPHILGTKP